MVAKEEDVNKGEETPTALELKRQELAATIRYGEQLGDQLKSEDLSEDERKELDEEMGMVTTKAEGLRDELKTYEKQMAMDRKVRNIGRQVFGERKPEEETPRFRDAVEALLGDARAKAAVSDKESWAQNPSTIAVEFKAPVDPTTDNPGDLRQTLRPGIVTPAVYPNRVGDLFAQATMDGSSVFWLFSDDLDGGADLVDYAQQKPQGSGTLDVTSIPARKIAATFTVPDDALDDLPGLESTLRQVLLVGPGGLASKAEDQYINGTGTGTPGEIKGVLALNPDGVSNGDNLAEQSLNAAMEIEAETNFQATAIVVNPANYSEFLFLESSAGFPLQAAPGFWREPDLGIRIVRSKAVAEGTVIVGAFNTSILYTRQAVNIAMSNQGLGLFDYNLTMFRAETRQALVHPYGKKTYRVVSVAS